MNDIFPLRALLMKVTISKRAFDMQFHMTLGMKKLRRVDVVLTSAYIRPSLKHLSNVQLKAGY